MKSKTKKNFLLAALSIVMIFCVALASALLPKAKVLAGEKDAYKYTLAYSDNFDDGNIDGWSVVRGGSSYSYITGGATKKNWRFNGENHIAYKQGLSTDYGMFLYGTANSTDYVFEVKMRADVEETLGEYLTTNAANLGAGLTLNTHLPFFVTDYAPNTSYHTFIGRSVCISNYAIGFYEYTYLDQDAGTLSGGWAKKSATDTATASARIKNTFGDDFDWRDWHTIRVQANATACSLYLDGALMVTAENSGFTKATATKGYAGFAGVCNEKYKPLHFDDFNYWTKNASYDSSIKTEATVNSINAADFRDTTKVALGSSAPKTALEETTENKLLYDLDVYMGTDHRVLTDYSYTSLNAVVGMDIERQKAAKGVVAGETYTGTTRISTSNVTGILFNGSFTNGKYNGYQLCYYAIYYQNSFQNVVNLYLNKLTNSAIANTNTDQILIGKLTGTTSCVVDMNVEGGYLTVTPYATKADYQSGTKATLKSSASSVTVTDGAYKVKLPTYDATVGGDYTEGNFGFRCQSGSTSATNHLQLMCDVEFISFSGKAQVIPPITEPLAAETATKTVSVSTPANGAVTVNGAAAKATQTVETHSEVKLVFTPNSGYIIDNVTINGVKMGAITEFTISNITSDYTVEVSFTNVKTVEVYLLAGQSNAAGFTPVNGLYKGYTYGGEVDEEKLATYEAGYTDIMYYGVTQSADPENAGVKWNHVTVGKGAGAYRIGPELGFADAMTEYYGGSKGKAAVIKYAVGATGFGNASETVRNTYGNWMSPSAISAAQEAGETLHEKAGLLYNNLIETVTIALEALVAQGYQPVVKGAMWLQGCADAKVPQANKYQHNISCLINDLRADVTEIMTELSIAQDCAEMPFVICKIGADLRNADDEAVVREQMQMAAAALTNVRIVETDDFVLPDVNDNNDVWHFSVKGMLAIGNRFADVLAQMNGKKAVVNYSVTFDADGGSGTFAPQTVAQYMSVTEPSEAPEKAGFTFLGWFAEDSETAWSFTSNAVKGNTKLTAKWDAIDYTLTFDLNDGVFALGVETKESYTAADEAYTLPVPVKAGYTFGGWYENADFSGDAVTALATGSTGNKTYYAKWTAEAIKYTVTVTTPENGTLEVSAKGSVDAGTMITVTATPAAGYKLVKVTVNGVDFTGTQFLLGEDTTIAAVFERDITLYAITVTQGANGTVSVDKTYAGENDIVTVAVTPDKGYELVSIKVNGEAIDGTSFVVTGEMTVTAEFAKASKKSDKGCGGVAALGGLTMALACAGVVLNKKRKK